MANEIEDREKDGCRFLNTSKAPERPLPVVLLDGPSILYSSIGDQMHALVLAVIGARPSGESQGE